MLSGSKSTRIITIQTPTSPSEERRGRGAGMGVRGGLDRLRPPA